MSTDLLPVRSEELSDLAARLRRVAACADQAVTTGIELDGWSGPAATAATEARQQLRARAALTRTSCAEAGEAISWLASVVADLAPAVARVTAARRAAAEAHAEWDGQVWAYKSNIPDPAPAMVRATSDQAREINDEYVAAARRVVDALDRLRVQVTDRPLAARDHLEHGVEAFWRNGFVEPAALAWGLSGQGFSDSSQWKANWRGLWDGARHAATHPVDTAVETGKATVAWDEFSAGEWGKAGGSILSMAALPGRLKDHAALRKFPHNVADANAPRPVVQTWEEMLEGVDLTRHEHYHLGHVLRRHVDVSIAYLRDRARHGTLEDSGKRGHKPDVVSAWHSQAIAERTITEVLRANREAIEHWRTHPNGRPLTLDQRFGNSLGHYLETANPEGQLSLGRSAVVTLNIKKGQLFIETAYVNP